MLKNDNFPWDSFRSELYSDWNYGTSRPEDRWLTAQLANFYRDVPPDSAVLDVGTGPNLIALLAAVGRAKTVTAWEFADPNVAWLQKTIADNKKLPERWVKFWQILCETAPEIYNNMDPFEALTSLVKIQQGSIFDLPGRHWDAATMFFVAETITGDMSEFQEACQRYAKAVKPGGIIAAAFMERSTWYSIGNVDFPAVSVSVGEIAAAFADHVDVISIERVPISENPIRSGYEGMLFLTATVRDYMEGK